MVLGPVAAGSGPSLFGPVHGPCEGLLTVKVLMVLHLGQGLYWIDFTEATMARVVVLDL